MPGMKWLGEWNIIQYLVILTNSGFMCDSFQYSDSVIFRFKLSYLFDATIIVKMTTSHGHYQIIACFI